MKQDKRLRWGGLLGNSRMWVKHKRKKLKDEIKWTGPKQFVVNKILEGLGK